MPALNQPAGPSGQGPAGLTTAQVRKRIQAGQVNTPPESPTKTVKRIVLENLFSFFNIIFYIIAGFLIAVGSFGELIFLLVVAAIALFICAAVLIIYYKQISEGYEDKKRFEIMQKVGMSRREVKRSIRAQVLMVFFLPLVTSFVLKILKKKKSLRHMIGGNVVSSFSVISLKEK